MIAGSLLKSADPSIKHKAPVASDEEKELERRCADFRLAAFIVVVFKFVALCS